MQTGKARGRERRLRRRPGIHAGARGQFAAEGVGSCGTLLCVRWRAGAKQYCAEFAQMIVCVIERGKYFSDVTVLETTAGR
jgi:hypothetical protein